MRFLKLSFGVRFRRSTAEMLGILGSKGLMMDLHRMNVHMFLNRQLYKRKNYELESQGSVGSAFG
jgi:hypothetical protein